MALFRRSSFAEELHENARERRVARERRLLERQRRRLEVEEENILRMVEVSNADRAEALGKGRISLANCCHRLFTEYQWNDQTNLFAAEGFVEIASKLVKALDLMGTVRAQEETQAMIQRLIEKAEIIRVTDESGFTAGQEFRSVVRSAREGSAIMRYRAEDRRQAAEQDYIERMMYDMDLCTSRERDYARHFHYGDLHRPRYGIDIPARVTAASLMDDSFTLPSEIAYSRRAGRHVPAYPSSCPAAVSQGSMLDAAHWTGHPPRPRHWKTHDHPL